MNEYRVKSLNHTFPVIQVRNGIPALISTGADVPIASCPLSLLSSKFDAILKYRDVTIPTFAGSFTGDVYTLNSLIIGPFTFVSADFVVYQIPLGTNIYVPADGIELVINYEMIHQIKFSHINSDEPQIIFKVGENESLQKKFEIIPDAGTVRQILTDA